MNRDEFLRRIAELTLGATEHQLEILLTVAEGQHKRRGTAQTLPPPRDPLVTLPEVGT
jgi:hypothetical protein